MGKTEFTSVGRKRRERKPPPRASVARAASALALIAGLSPGASGANAAESARACVDATPAPPVSPARRAREARGKRRDLLEPEPTSLADFAAKFKAKYGIDVTVNRQIDTTTVQQVTTEHTTGRHIADLWIVAARPYVLGALRNGWVADARGSGAVQQALRPHEAREARKGVRRRHGDRELRVEHAAVAARAARLHRRPQPRPRRRQARRRPPGCARPSTSGATTSGRSTGRTSSRLAALKPKLYVSSFPLQNALAAGEVAAAVFVTPQTLDLKAQGAPVDFRLTPGGSWNSPWWGMILKEAPHPAAAQLLANYMVTAEGQEAINKGFGAVMKDIPGTYFVAPRTTKLSSSRRRRSRTTSPTGTRSSYRGLMWVRSALREGLRQAAASTRSVVRLAALAPSEAASMRRARAPTRGAHNPHQASCAMRAELWRMGASPVPSSQAGALARRFEDMGWDGLAVPEAHGLMPDPYAVLGAAAETTTTLRLGTAVAIPLRHPLLAASAMATVQGMSQGRARFGLGRGDSGVRCCTRAPCAWPNSRRTCVSCRPSSVATTST